MKWVVECALPGDIDNYRNIFICQNLSLVPNFGPKVQLLSSPRSTIVDWEVCKPNSLDGAEHSSDGLNGRNRRALQEKSLGHSPP